MNLAHAREQLEAVYPFPQYECGVNVDTTRSKYTKEAVEFEFTVCVDYRDDGPTSIFNEYGPNLTALVARAIAAKDAEQVNPVDVADCATEEHAQ